MENNLLTSDTRGQRTLATVVFTDCVGFSARMSVDEDHTLDLIRRDLQFMKHVCSQFEGRVLKSTGDGLLMCFNSAVKAVECAIEIQTILTENVAKLPPEDALEHRIGIHLADMFISSTDVMGNGVNIAARLQTEADPGGICISQTVYDVIKTKIHLETVYLGPRELKNIHEVVPVYKILLTPEVESAVQVSSTIRSLEQSRQLPRIKKLLLYVCRNIWESDQAKLSSLNLHELVQELLAIAPTPKQIRQCLDAAVKTLSKPTEYAMVANLILTEVSRLRPSEPDHPLVNSRSEEDTQALVEVEPSRNSLQVLYEQVAQELEQTGHSLRIKKLAFYVCRKRWENDADQLHAIDLYTLVAELHQLAPTAQQLRLVVDGFVQTLSKQAEYSLIANTIVSKLQRIYLNSEGAFSSVPPNRSPGKLADDQPAVAISAHPPAQPAYSQVAHRLEQEPNLPRIKKLMLYLCRQQWEGDSAKLDALDLSYLIQELHQLTQTPEQLESALNSVVKTLNKQAEYMAIGQTIVTHFRRLYLPDSGPVQDNLLPPATAQVPPPPQTQQQNSLPNLFDYRLAIMKSANPLRAKILLFSALHQDFDFGSQDWLNLKMYELDGLLRQLLSVCKAYTDMEAILYSAARRLRDPEENIQTADTVMKCLRSFYLYGGSVATLSSTSDKTEINLDIFEVTTSEMDRVENEHTCQVLSSELNLTEAIVNPPPQLGGTPFVPASLQVDSNSANNPTSTHL